MPEYRRSHVKGGTFFFTLVTYLRKSILIEPQSIAILHTVWEDVQTKHPFHTDAIYLLPDHIHCIWTLPEDDADYSLRWKEIKRIFTHRYVYQTGPKITPTDSRQKRLESTIWQRRFWEHTIRDEKDLENHLNYIHYNPVKHGLVTKPVDWEWSSFRYFVKGGAYDKDWGNQGNPIPTGFRVDAE